MNMNIPRTYIVKRLRQGVLVASYGPFKERVSAETVALTVIEKHRDCIVQVEAVHPATVGA